ncbi:class I adenylate-forming enzyme family protein [Actinophytocola algeriensis]|uniref:Acyl-CoA synthetase (AMP-forming)/AMP-acid ligase II n=1 Tax=Actinophytocola algeriensis TaxID=1768010 RepID=A0A7W7QCD2_9PSEU|nr:AMP-binding protein [Actinophytocola algeriensis]MBB4910908.1 acyl-CoA synthetase (AMP-forming)/AMP-acid ligase II [Actinophytocola algeriensis]MBE1473901.1 acyl-CoA synthetase (AMP-forming)/AMP-acid ligase II [Actinophytocola algeriensis]
MSVQQNSRIADWIRINASTVPNRDCFVTGTVSYTFGEVNSRVNRIASHLRRMGVGKGDRVALFATDSPQYVETLLACMKLGAVYVPLNFRLAKPELQTLLRTAGAKVLFFSDRYTDMVRAVDVPGLTATISYDSASGDESYEALVAGGDDVEIDTPVSDDELVCLAFTSGTTALPKGVMHSQRMAKHMVMQCIVERRMTNISFHYSAAPLFHVGGMLYTLAGVARGHTSLVLPAFDAATVAHWMANRGLDGVFLVPTMIDTLLHEPAVVTGDFSKLGSIGYGAAPMSPSLLRRAMDRFHCDFMNMFGAGTEAGLQTVLTPEDHRLALDGQEHLLGSIGKAGMGVVLRLCDPDDTAGLNDVPDGEVGEIVTRSDAVMSGYLDQPEETAKVIVDGWFRGGDMAWRDKDGYLYLSGRKKDMIIRGGENIYPVEIEDVLGRFPGVREVAVVGVPDEHWGEVVRAHIVLESGARLDEDAVRAYCRDRLAGYKVPAVFHVDEDLPRNASGKVLKRTLRAV